jgi:hypothetical protein
MKMMNKWLIDERPTLSAGVDYLSYLHGHVQESRDVQPTASTLDDSWHGRLIDIKFPNPGYLGKGP